MFLDCLPLVTRGLHSWVPQHYNNQKDSSWQVSNPPSEYYTDSRLKLFLCHGAPAWEANFMFAMHLEAMDVLSGNIGWWVPSLFSLAHYSFLVPPPKGTYTLVWSPSFCNCHPSNTSRLSGLEARSFYDCGPTRQCIFAYFKSWYIKVWLSICLKLGAKISLFGILTNLGTTSTTGTYRE